MAWLLRWLALLELGLRGAAATEIVFGSLQPMSGGIQSIGQNSHALTVLAAEDVNADVELLPNYHLSILPAFDTQGDPFNAVKGAIHASHSVGTKAVLGAHNSGSTKPASLILGANGIAMMSCGSTSAALSDKSSYPLFARTIPPDSKQAYAIVDACIHFKWTRINVVYAAGDYAEDFLVSVREALAQRISEGHDIEIDTAVQIFRTPQSAGLVFTTLQQSASRIVIILGYPQDLALLEEKVLEKELAGKYTFLGGDSIASAILADMNSSVTNGLFGVRPVMVEGVKADELISRGSAIYDSVLLHQDSYMFLCYDAVFLFAHALHSLLEGPGNEGRQVDNISGAMLMETMLSTKFEGLSGTVSIDEYGDRDAQYELVYAKGKEFVKAGMWSVQDGVAMSDGAVIWNDGTTNVPVDVTPAQQCPAGFQVFDPGNGAAADCIPVSADYKQQRMFWGLSIVTNLLGLQHATALMVMYVYIPELRNNSIQLSFLSMVIPDFVFTLTYFLFHLTCTIRGLEPTVDQCQALAFITFACVIATFAGPVTVSIVTYNFVKGLVENKLTQKVPRKKICGYIAFPWFLGLVLAGACMAYDLLGSYRGLYCYANDWNHFLTGGITIITLMVACVTTAIVYALVYRLHSQLMSITISTPTSPTSPATPATPTTPVSVKRDSVKRESTIRNKNAASKRTVIKRGLSLILCLFVTWCLFALCGLMHLLGSPAPVGLEMAGALFISLQATVNFWILFRKDETMRSWCGAVIVQGKLRVNSRDVRRKSLGATYSDSIYRSDRSNKPSRSSDAEPLVPGGTRTGGGTSKSSLPAEGSQSTQRLSSILAGKQ